ncbi:carbohydrate ABC transporter permease [Streptomyces sp. 900116325]
MATPPKVSRRRSANPRRLPYLLIAPAGLLMLGFIAYPMVSVFYYSLQNYNVTKPWRNGFAGFDNFTRIFTEDDQFWATLGFSAQWVVTQVALQLTFGLALALIVNQTFIGRGISRAMVFSPWAVSGVLTSTIWILLYNSSTGFSRYLADAGIGDYGTSVFADTGTVFWAATVAELWRGVPFFAILILADLQSVSKELYEAAAVDGAGLLSHDCRDALHVLDHQRHRRGIPRVRRHQDRPRQGARGALASLGRLGAVRGVLRDRPDRAAARREVAAVRGGLRPVGTEAAQRGPPAPHSPSSVRHSSPVPEPDGRLLTS